MQTTPFERSKPFEHRSEALLTAYYHLEMARTTRWPLFGLKRFFGHLDKVSDALRFLRDENERLSNESASLFDSQTSIMQSMEDVRDHNRHMMDQMHKLGLTDPEINARPDSDHVWKLAIRGLGRDLAKSFKNMRVMDVGMFSQLLRNHRETNIGSFLADAIEDGWKEVS